MSKASAPARTILIMDDDPQLRRLMKRTLEGMGYLVLEADSGETAASVSSKHQGRIDRDVKLRFESTLNQNAGNTAQTIEPGLHFIGG